MPRLAEKWRTRDGKITSTAKMTARQLSETEKDAQRRLREARQEGDDQYEYRCEEVLRDVLREVLRRERSRDVVVPGYVGKLVFMPGITLLEHIGRQQAVVAEVRATFGNLEGLELTSTRSRVARMLKKLAPYQEEWGRRRREKVLEAASSSKTPRNRGC